MTTAYVIEKSDIENICPAEILNRLPENWKKTVSYPDCYTHRDAANKFVSIMNEMGWGSLLDC
jgi:hypothetical protein